MQRYFTGLDIPTPQDAMSNPDIVLSDHLPKVYRVKPVAFASTETDRFLAKDQSLRVLSWKLIRESAVCGFSAKPGWETHEQAVARYKRILQRLTGLLEEYQPNVVLLQDADLTVLDEAEVSSVFDPYEAEAINVLQDVVKKKLNWRYVINKEDGLIILYQCQKLNLVSELSHLNNEFEGEPCGKRQQVTFQCIDSQQEFQLIHVSTPAFSDHKKVSRLYRHWLSEAGNQNVTILAGDTGANVISPHETYLRSFEPSGVQPLTSSGQQVVTFSQALFTYSESKIIYCAPMSYVKTRLMLENRIIISCIDDDSLAHVKNPTLDVDNFNQTFADANIEFRYLVDNNGSKWSAIWVPNNSSQSQILEKLLGSHAKHDESDGSLYIDHRSGFARKSIFLSIQSMAFENKFNRAIEVDNVDAPDDRDSEQVLIPNDGSFQLLEIPDDNEIVTPAPKKQFSLNTLKSICETNQHWPSQIWLEFRQDGGTEQEGRVWFKVVGLTDSAESKIFKHSLDKLCDKSKAISTGYYYQTTHQNYYLTVISKEKIESLIEFLNKLLFILALNKQITLMQNESWITRLHSWSNEPKIQALTSLKNLALGSLSNGSNLEQIIILWKKAHSKLDDDFTSSHYLQWKNLREFFNDLGQTSIFEEKTFLRVPTNAEVVATPRSFAFSVPGAGYLVRVFGSKKVDTGTGVFLEELQKPKIPGLGNRSESK